MLLEIIVHYILWPGLFLFALMVLPLGFTRSTASKVVLLLGRIKLLNISILLFIAFTSLIVTGLEMLEWFKKHSQDSREVEQIKIELLPVDFDRAGRHARRWRLERNLYMGALTSVLYFALHTIANLVDQLAERTKKDQEKNRENKDK